MSGIILIIFDISNNLELFTLVYHQLILMKMPAVTTGDSTGETAGNTLRYITGDTSRDTLGDIILSGAEIFRLKCLQDEKEKIEDKVKQQTLDKLRCFHNFMSKRVS